MPLISKHKPKEQVLEKLYSLFFEIVGKQYSRHEFDLIMNDILTPTERIMIAKRIAIMYLIMKKIDYRIICENLKVSATTVFKFRFMLERSEGITATFNKILKNEKIGLLLEEIFLVFVGPGVPGVNWSLAWKHKLDLERRKTEGI